MASKSWLGGELCLDKHWLHEMRRNQKLWQIVAETFGLLREPVYRYLAGMLGDPAGAEDLVQEAFLRLYQSLSKGQQVGNVRAWVYRIAHNLAVDQLRRNNRVDSLDASWDKLCEQEETRVIDAEQGLLQTERKERFRKALQSLSPQERCCLNLKAEGLLYREIAEVLGLRTSTVATFIDRAIKKLLCEKER